MVDYFHFLNTSNEVIWSQKMSGKKGHFGNFSDWAGMAVPCQVGPQESLTGIEKLFLSWVPMNIQKDWKAKLEIAYSVKMF